jgi:hypothetical protein
MKSGSSGGRILHSLRRALAKNIAELRKTKQRSRGKRISESAERKETDREEVVGGAAVAVAVAIQ